MPLPFCANVPSLVSLAQKFTNSEDPIFKKPAPFGHVLLVPLIAAYHYGTYSPLVIISPQSLSRIRPLAWSAVLKNKKRCKFLVRA